jgi:hypothetical protein
LHIAQVTVDPARFERRRDKRDALDRVSLAFANNRTGD